MKGKERVDTVGRRREGRRRGRREDRRREVSGGDRRGERWAYYGIERESALLLKSGVPPVK